MAFDINELGKKIIEFTKSEKFLKNLLIGLGFAAIIVLLSIIVLKNVSKEDYGVLYTNLSPDDAGSILSVLQEERIPYKIEGDGSIILVPEKKIYDVRLKLAAKGLPSSKVVGFEIFEEPKMGATHFQENINYIRAIEGELTRTIKQLDAVQNAKVNIALPQTSIFAREEDEAKASVVIKLWPGRDLTKEQIKSIVFLVSHAVPKLKPENVTVVDNLGRVLSDKLAENENGKFLETVDVKKKIEKDLEKRIQSMLARAIGPQNVVVRATVDIETAKINQQDEVYDPEKVAVVSERKIQEKEKGYKPKEQGAPGTPTNVPPVINTSNLKNITKDRSKKDVTTNYNVSKSLIQTQKNIFKIKKISVGVLVDGKYITKKDSNGTEIKQFVPRSKEELASYEELIKSAVGFDPKRGDVVTVVSVPFEAPKTVEIETEVLSKKDMALLLVIGGLALVLFVLLIIFAIKASKAKKAAKLAEEKALAESMKSMEKLHEKESEILNLEAEPAYQKILQMVDENPELIANMISKWIKEEK
ncbi:flagellar basal-body MS-ring/collar protein FliF [Nitrosophilus kaiyonis]|uniref:flagellar basal-body MS-ring/collar protein FliF n=1 Tax=Nitrosophilus kaiyonis TaxID=2930200 RepID=UPI002492A061|nr:flagellar basal-body MS-ring/collar protein FliF [Nitrosophilus kaiyonis]